MAEKGIPMSVRRLIAEADLASLNVCEFCVVHGISRWSFYSIRKRFDAEGEAGPERPVPKAQERAKSLGRAGTIASLPA